MENQMWLVDGTFGFATDEDLLDHLKANPELEYAVRLVNIYARPAAAPDAEANVRIDNPAPKVKHKFLEPLGRSGDTE